MIARLRLIVALGAVLLISACSSHDTVTVAVGAGSATVSTGDTLAVDLGEVNSSIGDAWFLVTPPDSGILTDQGSQFDTHCDQPGCGSRMSWHFTAAKAGTTKVTFRYCYRTRLDACDPGPGRGPSEPVSIAVTVT